MEEVKEFKGMNGIFISEHQMSNMTLERIVVSGPAILAILKVTKLSEKAQEDAVFALVDRSLDWNDTPVEIQVERMKAVLTQETVIEYLRFEEVIRPNCNMVQTGIDEEGSIVIEAYYTQLNREQRRAIDKSMSEEEKKNMVEAVNILSGQDNLVDLAAKKLERLQKQGLVGDQPMRKPAMPKKKK